MDVKADDGGVALPDPFRFVHKVPSEGDPGPAKEILPFAQYLFLLWLRQTAEHALIVQFGQRDIFCERKEPQGIPFAPEVIKQVPAGGEDAGLLKTGINQVMKISI